MFSYGSKLVLIFDMLAGRLEIFPLLLFVREGFLEKILKHYLSPGALAAPIVVYLIRYTISQQTDRGFRNRNPLKIFGRLFLPKYFLPAENSLTGNIRIKLSSCYIHNPEHLRKRCGLRQQSLQKIFSLQLFFMEENPCLLLKKSNIKNPRFHKILKKWLP